MSEEKWSRFDGNHSSDKLAEPVGLAEAASIFDKKPIVSRSNIKLLTISDAAEFLTISASSMRRLQEGRRIPFFKIGGSIRFATEDLLSYLARQRIGAVGE